MAVTVPSSTLTLGGAISLNGSSQYLTTTGPTTIGAGIFTIELWVNFAALPGAGSFASLTCQGSNFRLFLEGSSNALSVWENTTPKWVTNATGMVINTWYHVCVMRTSSTQVDIYINGVLQTKSTNTTTVVTYTATGMTVGFDNSSATYYLNGLVTNQRYVNGVAMYPQGGFQTPNKPLTNVTGTQLLLLAQSAGTFTNDSSTANTGGTPYTVTATGTPTYSATTPFSVLGGWNITANPLGSVSLNGTSQYLSAPSSTLFAFGSSVDFTVEAWIYMTSYSASIYGSAIGTTNGAQTGWMLNFGEGTDRYRIISNGSGVWTDNVTCSAGNGIVLNTWTHVAMVRSGANLYLFKNGAIVGSIATASAYNFTSPSNLLNIGYTSDGSSGTRFFPGYITNVRVVKGVAVYTGAFTPPTAPLTISQSAGTNISAVSSTQTSLLLNLPNNSALLTDSSVNNLTITNNATATASALTPFTAANSTAFLVGGPAVSTGSIQFPGTTNGYGTGTASSTTLNVAANQDFTWEAWMYTRGNVGGSASTIYSNYNAFGATAFAVFAPHTSFGNGNNYTLAAWSSIFTSTANVVQNTWTHLAVVRSGTAANNVKLYINGNNTTGFTATNNNAVTSVGGNCCWIGSSGDALGALFNGFITNMRFVVGTAVYTTNFTPATAPLPPTQYANAFGTPSAQISSGTSLLLSAIPGAGFLTNYTPQSGAITITNASGNLTSNTATPFP